MFNSRFKNGLLSENRVTKFDEENQVYFFSAPGFDERTAINFIGVYEDEIQKSGYADFSDFKDKARITAWDEETGAYILSYKLRAGESKKSVLEDHLGHLEDNILALHKADFPVSDENTSSEDIERIKSVFKRSGYNNYEFSDAVLVNKDSNTYAIFARYTRSLRKPEYALFIYSPTAEFLFKDTKFGLSQEKAQEMLLEVVKNPDKYAPSSESSQFASPRKVKVG